MDLAKIDKLTSQERNELREALGVFNPVGIGAIAGLFDIGDFDIYNDGTLAIPKNEDAIESINAYSSYVGGRVNLFNLNNLTVCDLSYNELESVEIANCESFSILYCGSNPTLTNFKVNNCPNLITINIGGSAIQNLDFSGISNIVTLSCDAISDLKSVNLTGCNKLNYVNFAGAGLSQTEIDKILKACVDTGKYSGVCALVGGTNAAPSTKGLEYKKNLTTFPKNWTVTTN
jgi:hypothetical protein